MSDHRVREAAEELAKAALGQHRGDLEVMWQTIASSYTEAMMAAQLMERAAAIVFVADAMPLTDQLDSDATDKHFNRAFNKVTLGHFKNENPIAADAELASMVEDSWQLRNSIAHRFFLDNLLALFGGQSSESLVAQLSDARRQFEDVASRLMALAENVATDRGVDPTALAVFGNLAQAALVDSPERFEAFNPWRREDGEGFASEVAASLGINIHETMRADAETSGQEVPREQT